MERRNDQFEIIFDDIRAFLPRMIDACIQMERRLYGELNSESWREFGEIVEGIDDLYKTLSTIQKEFEHNEQYSLWASEIGRLKINTSDYFQLLNACMDVEDYVGASDILRYEFVPLFEKLSNVIGHSESERLQRFQANMNLIQHKFPSVYKTLHNNANQYIQCQHVYTSKGIPNLGVTGENGQTALMYSSYNPIDEADRWSESLRSKMEGKSDIFIYGFGLGYHIASHARNYPDHRLYVYEPNIHVLLAALYVIDLQMLLEHWNIVDFYVGSSKQEVDEMIYRYLKFMKGEAEIVTLPSYYRLFPTALEQFSADSQRLILNYHSAIRVYDKFGWEWLTNSIYNLPSTLYSPSISQLQDRFEGLTAVVIGAGPSLAKDIEWVKKLHHSALIIAAGTTIQSLLHFGVEPHLIVSMDGSEKNYEAFQGLSIQHIPLLYTPTVQYRIIDEMKDRLLHVHFSNDLVTKNLMQIDDRDPVFPPNHSVTGTAIRFASYIGCKEIVLVGQDLSYPSNELYAPGARHFSTSFINQMMENAELTVENVQGNLNRTDYSMKGTLSDIEELISLYPSVKFINTSQVGAKIKGTGGELLEDVVTRLEKKDSQLNEFLQGLQQLDGYEQERVHNVYDRLKQMQGQLQTCSEQLERIVQQINAAEKQSRLNPNKCIAAFQSIDRDWKAVIAGEPFKTFFHNLFRNALNDFERDLPELTNENNLIRKSKLANTILKPLVTKFVERIPDISEVVDEGVRRLDAKKLQVNA